MGLVGILIAVVILIYLSYRGMSPLVVSPIAAVLAACFVVPTQSLAYYTQTYMSSLGGFVVSNFPIFLLGAIFGRMMEESGSARVIARRITSSFGPSHAVTAVALACMVLTYGGVSVFVAVFAILPLAVVLFREADYAPRLVPAAIGLGGMGAACASLPGAVQLHNVLPGQFYGTTTAAAWGIGLTASVLMFGIGWWYLDWRLKTYLRRGERFDPEWGPAKTVRDENAVDQKTPSFLVATFPLILVLGLNYLLSEWVFRAESVQPVFAFLSESPFGTNLAKVAANWSLILSLSVAIVWMVILHFRRWEPLNRVLTSGANGSLLPTFNTAAVVGFGAVVVTLPAFLAIKGGCFNAFGNPLLSQFVAMQLGGLATGSPLGGLGLVLNDMGPAYAGAAMAQGIPMEWMHRFAAMSSLGLACLPHCGLVNSLFAICGQTPKKAYLDLGMVAAFIPMLVTVLMLVFCV
ncbi:MAG: GntP family permease, partial [Planctomycetia bacterium]|nr:GntP family permease [Planctomycetia bacterium]